MLSRLVAGSLCSLCCAFGLSVVLSGAEAAVADAAMQRDNATVRALLKRGGDVNAAQGDGMTALHWAAANNDVDLAAMLLYAGANVRATTRLGGYTPLHLASQAGHAEVSGTLLGNGAAVNAATSTGATPLMLAAAAGKVEPVKLLLDRGADVNASDSPNGETALMFASSLDRADVVKLLLSRGADVSATAKVVDVSVFENAPGEDALDKAGRAANNARPAAQPAASPGRETAGMTRPYRYNELIGKQGGLAALHFAARQGHRRSVEALVANGANVNQPSAGDKTTAILIATINGHFDIAKYLLEHGADPRAASAAGATPLYAVLNVQWAPKSFYPQPRAYLQQETSYLDMMRALLDAGADPNARLNRKLWYTQYNFDLLRVDESGATPFWRAAYASDVDAMKLLVSYGADPNIPTVKPAGRTRRDDGSREQETPAAPPLPAVPVGGPGIPPLLAAAGAGYGEGFAGNAHRFAPVGMLAAVTYLVEILNVNVNATDHEGYTASHHAAARGDNEMIRYLVSKGADVTKVSRGGQTTVDMANGPVQRIQPFPETIKLLESLGAKNNHKCVSC